MDRLEDALREESIHGLVLLLRGGEDTRGKFLRQAALLEQRYTYAGEPVRGISVFAVQDADDESAVLASKLRTYRSYRRVGGEQLAQLAVLLPTFRSPHWTVLFRSPIQPTESEPELLEALLGILGPVLDNPQYERNRWARR